MDPLFPWNPSVVRRLCSTRSVYKWGCIMRTMFCLSSRRVFWAFIPYQSVWTVSISRFPVRLLSSVYIFCFCEACAHCFFKTQYTRSVVITSKYFYNIWYFLCEHRKSIVYSLSIGVKYQMFILSFMLLSRCNSYSQKIVLQIIKTEKHSLRHVSLASLPK